MLAVAAGVAVFYRKRISEQCFGSLKEAVFTCLQILYFLWFFSFMKDMYEKQIGYVPQTVLWVGIVLGFLVACFIFQRRTGRKVIAFPVAVSLLGEAIYGSGFFAREYLWMSPEIVAYMLWVFCGVLFLWYVLRGGMDTTNYLLIFASVSVFQFSACVFAYEYTIEKAFEKTVHFWATPQCLLSTLAVVGFYMLLKGVLGKGIAIVVYGIVFLVFYVGNLIEMIFHQSVLKPMDFLAVREAAAIAANYFNVGIVALIVAAVAAAVCIAFRFRKKIADFLRPSVSGASVLFGCMLMFWFFAGVYTDAYFDWDIFYSYIWGTEIERLEDQGFVPQFYYHCLRLGEIYTDEPKGYDENLVEAILRPYKQTQDMGKEAVSTGTDIRPDVIYIMLESIFDVDELQKYGVTYSEDPDPVMDEYQIAKTVSPVCGGLTARAEFEGLTGLSGTFYPQGTIEYLVLWGGKAKPRYSLAQEFKKQGYSTYAIHQNARNYYNRSSVYESMGFETYIAEDTYGEDVAEEYKNQDSFLTNAHFLKLLKEQLEQDEKTPKFIWGITIESHMPYTNKYSDLEIHASYEGMTPASQLELDNYIQSVKRTDEFVGELIEYVKQREKPTVVVMFGDHKPSLQALWDLGVNNNPEEQYLTSCIAYSNFGEITLEEDYISLNYIPGLVVESAGITDSRFFNYLNDLRKRHPVMETPFLTEEMDADRENYSVLQYDIIFGEGYSGR